MHFLFIRLCLVILVCGTTILVAAQDRRQPYDSISRLLKTAFNSQLPMRMYALTAPVYKEKMNEGSFSEGAKKFYSKTGEWEELHFREGTDGGMAYTARFRKETQILFLQLDEQNRILRFNFKPVPFVKSARNDKAASDNPLASFTDSLVEKLARPYIQQSHTAGLCIAVIQKGVVHRYSYGETKKGNGRLPDPETTLFEIGSLTKTITSLLLAREVVAKKMALNDPVNRYLPDSIPPLSYHDTAITLQTLANHTSGFPRLPSNISQPNADPADPYRHYNENLLYSFLMSFRLTAAPGTQYAYSNCGAGLLGHLLAHKAERGYEQLVREHICLPLQMTHTRITLDAADSARIAQGYNEKGVATSLWDLGVLQGAGAMRSTLNDMVRYTQAQLGRSPGPLKNAILLTHQVSFRGKDNRMGLGWDIHRKQDHIYWKNGATGGFRAFVGFDTERQLGVVILSNTAEEVTNIGQAILEEQTD